MTPNNKSPKDPIHGNIYQLKLLMLFLYQGIHHKYSFRLGTEIAEAKKFDDIVFGYEEQNDFKFRLLQAKHRIDKSKKITAEDLLTNSDTDFCLAKYYFSYHESKSENLFKNGSIKDIIICTNIDFDLSDLQKAGITLDPVTESDPILDINNIKLATNKQPVRWKLNSRISTKLKEVIESSFIPKLANKVAFFLLNSKTISKEGYLFGQYQYVLRNEVIDVKNKRFKEDFIKNKNLSKDAEKFRYLLNTEILIQSKGTIQMEDLNDIIANKKIINDKTIGLAVRKDFGKDKTDCGEDKVEDKTSPDKKWPSTSVSIDDIKEYLGVLVFAVNQLDEEELGQTIMKEIGNEFNRITTEYVYNRIFQRMLIWIQGKNSKGERTGHSLHSWEEGKRLIDDARKEILNCLAPDCKKMLEDVPFCFNSHTEVETFLSSKHGIWLLPTETPWLSTLLVYHTVKNIPNRSSFFFNWQNVISSNGTIISDFQDLDDFLIVLTCNQLINAEDITDDLSLAMNEISNSGTSKKVIIITRTNEALNGILKHKFQVAYESKIKIEFNSLDDASKEKMLSKKNIIFNGNFEELHLNELLCCSTQIENLTLDAIEIESLLTEPEVKVWTTCPQQFNTGCMIYKAIEIVSSNQIREAVELNKNDIFAFFGSRNDAEMLISREIKELKQFRCTELSSLLITHHFFFINDGEEREEFDLLCQVAGNVCQLKPSVHMLKSLGNDEWLWIQTYSQNIYIRRYFKPHLLQKSLVKSICSPQSSEFMIFSGMMENKFFNLLPDSYRSLKVSNKLYNYKVLNSEKDAEEEFINMKQRILLESDDDDDVAQGFHCSEVHWLKAWEEEEDVLMLEWHQSFGKKNHSLLSKISLHLVSHDRFLPEDSLIKLKQRVIVLSDNPGMGKSSSLNRLAELLKKTNPLSIVIKLDLNENQEQLTLFYEYTKTNLVRTLLNIKPKTKHSSLSRKILEHKLEYLEQVFILCDAFDEVAEDKQENLLKWFDFVLEITKVSLWITTRPNYKEKLEQHFSVLSYSFKTLVKSEQIDYLNRFWKMRLTFSGANQNVLDFSTIAKKVTEPFNYFLVKKYSETFVQSPLMLRMLAEKYNVEFVRAISDDSLQVQNMKCLSTYKSFVDHVFEIYFFDKIKIVRGLYDDSKIVLKNAYSKAYGQLALKRICAKHYRDSVIYLGNKKKSISSNTLFRIGLMQSHGGLISKFIHPSFEEYFAVNVVFNKCMSNPKSYIWWELLLNLILTLPFSRRIFDDRLENSGLLLPEDETFSIIYDILQQQVSSESKQVALWIAADEDLKRTVSFLSKGMKWSQIEQILKLEKGTKFYVGFRREFKSSIDNYDYHNENLEELIINQGKFLNAERIFGKIKKQVAKGIILS